MINLDVIVKIIGVLGFFISVITFVLTRYERRAKCIAEIVVGDLSNYSSELTSEADLLEETLKIRITNIGGQPVILKPETFFFSALNKKITKNQNELDWFGINQLPSPLNPGCSCEVGVITEGILSILGFEDLKKYCNELEHKKTEIPIEVGVSDLNNRTYKSKGFTYYYYVYSLERHT
ncbi:hypothetical protein A6E05_19130 [Aliivibrio sp. 1S165]|uniref:hypothetical protein n=1 Tax=unclassified Aliivibrio TaxID=2645654 RepID=UPI00080E66D6|nr:MULTISPECIES: hypothetical protein [unclassified Aliivibrio]OCH14561.1 hypothetical protein A6E05_19130 [Aliivibrio sp. 1S165]OCH31259.1 hypothetical protein A6E06_19145 [Aliivibrio sp. 1S175]